MKEKKDEKIKKIAFFLISPQGGKAWKIFGLDTTENEGWQVYYIIPGINKDTKSP